VVRPEILSFFQRVVRGTLAGAAGAKELKLRWSSDWIGRIPAQRAERWLSGLGERATICR
jgi:hypothetical protein